MKISLKDGFGKIVGDVEIDDGIAENVAGVGYGPSDLDLNGIITITAGRAMLVELVLAPKTAPNNFHPMPEKCATCKFWEQIRTLPSGFCRRRSPVLSADRRTVFPTTRHDDYCGEYAFSGSINTLVIGPNAAAENTTPQLRTFIEQKYAKQAVQFDPQVQPWPTGVCKRDGKYIMCWPRGGENEIQPGDYAVYWNGRPIMFLPALDFEEQYFPVSGTLESRPC